MTSIIIFAPVLFYRLLIFRSFFALGGQLIILHGNDNGIAFFYLCLLYTSDAADE